MTQWFFPALKPPVFGSCREKTFHASLQPRESCWVPLTLRARLPTPPCPPWGPNRRGKALGEGSNQHLSIVLIIKNECSVPTPSCAQLFVCPSMLGSGVQCYSLCFLTRRRGGLTIMNTFFLASAWFRDHILRCKSELWHTRIKLVYVRGGKQVQFGLNYLYAHQHSFSGR